MARHRSRRDHTLPEPLRRLIAAAEHSFSSGDEAPNPEALRSLARLALVVVPRRGVFVAHDPDVCAAINRVAVAHLEFDEAKRAYRDALKVVPRFEERDPIQTAVNHLMSVSDDVHLYAGLMLGIASGR